MDKTGEESRKKEMELVENYMLDDTLRHALNELAKKTFWIDFESWVKGGYFEGDYIPHSFVENGKIISNVSANRMNFIQNGVAKKYIQIGTVMTDEAYRNKGLARRLIEYVVERYRDECDGIYLFANLDALDFYRKCGFAKATEYKYYTDMKPDKSNGSRFVPVDPSDEAMKQKYMDAVRNCAVNSSFEQTNKFGLQLFYTAGMDNVYYADDIDCFIVAESDSAILDLQSVICKERVNLEKVLKRLDIEYDKCSLGFVPHADDMEICTAVRYDGGDDYRLFYLGDELKSIPRDELYFPELSHA